MICCNLPHPLIYHMIEDYKANATPPDFEWWYADGWITIKCDSEVVSDWVREEVDRLESGVEANFYQE